MKNNILLGLILFVFIYATSSKAQESKLSVLDSLKHLKSKVDEYKFEGHALYEKYIQHINKLINNNNNNSKLHFYAHSILADIYKLEGNYDTAIKNYNKAIQYSEYANNTKDIATIYDNLVYIYRNIGELGRMYEYSEKAKCIKEKIGDIAGIHKTNLILAYNHKLTGNYLEAFKLSYDALNYFENQKDTSGILLSYHSITLIYRSLENYEKALNIHELCTPYLNENRFMKESSTLYNGKGNILIDIGDYQNGLNNLLKSLEIEKKIGDKTRILLRYNNIGVAYSYLKDFKPALKYFEECIKLYRAANNFRYLANIYNSVAMCYEQMNIPDSSINYYLKSIEIAKQYNVKEVHINSALSLSKVYGQAGNINSAYKYLKKYNELIESMDNLNASQQVITKEFEYLQQKDQVIKEIEHKNKTLFFVAYTSVLILVILISWIAIKKLRAKIKKSKLDKYTLENNKIELKKKINNQNKELISKILQLSDYNSAIEGTIQNLLKLKSSANENLQHKIQQVINNLEHFVNDNLWNEFEHMFIKVNPLLYENLSKYCPNLTVNERRLCALLYLNFSSKEIANITKQSHNSISVAKNRLKNKLGIKESANIVDILHSLMQAD